MIMFMEPAPHFQRYYCSKIDDTSYLELYHAHGDLWYFCNIHNGKLHGGFPTVLSALTAMTEVEP